MVALYKSAINNVTFENYPTGILYSYMKKPQNKNSSNIVKKQKDTLRHWDIEFNEESAV